ncbi:unnamed protein product, partial [Mesorhabditis spiculigera]
MGQRIDIFSQKAGAGDIAQLHATDNGNVMMNALPRDSRNRWVNVRDQDGYYVIPYQITGQFDSEEKSIIVGAMQRIANNTCIKFKPASGERDYVEIQNKQNEGCYTIVGRQPGRNVVMLEANDMATCVEPDIVIHELFHSIGLWHEHMRTDRDQFIRVHFENIPSYYQSQFEKVTPEETTSYGIPYDYRSVMHYAEDAFARPSTISMETMDPKFQKVIGKAPDASASDYGKVCIMYGCGQCMGKPFDEKTFVSSLNGVSALPTAPPVPTRPPIVPQIIVEGGGVTDGSDCFDLLSPICSMVSSGNFFFSCSSSLTSRICCRTCRNMATNDSNGRGSSLLGLFGRL